MELKDYIRILRFRWPTILGLTLVVSLGNFFLMRPGKPTFVATCHLLVKHTPVHVVMESGGMPPLWGDITRETRVAMLHTAPVLRRAAFLARDVLQGRAFWPRDGVDPPRDEEGRTEADRDIEKESVLYDADPVVVASLAHYIKTVTSYEQTKDAPEFVIISARGRDAKTAQTIANALAVAFQQVSKQSGMRRIREADEFVQSQIAERQATLREIHNKLEKIERETSLLEDARKTFADHLGLPTKREQLRRKEELLSRLDVDIAHLTDSLKNRVPAQKLPVRENPRVSWLQGELERLKRELARAELTLTSEHPEVRTIRSELESVKQELVRVTGETAIEHGVQILEANLLSLKEKRAERDSVARQIEALRKEIGEILRKLEEHTQVSPEYPVTPLAVESRVALTAQATAIAAEIEDLVKRRNQLKLYDLLKEDLIEILAYARPAEPIPAPARSSWPLGIVAGIVVGIGAAFFLEYVNQTVRTEYDVRRYVNLPVLGAIVFIKNETERLLLNVSARVPLHEVFNTIGMLLEAHAAEHKAKLFMVTSSRAEEGKSTVIANIAVAMARNGLKVALVDCDTRKSVLHRFFSADNSTGLTTYLNHHIVAADTGEKPRLHLADVLLPTEIENLKLLPAGPHPQNPVGLLKSETMKGLLRELREVADVVLVDVPPINLAVDAMVLAPLMDGTIFLVSAGEVTKEEVAYAKRLIEGARGNFVGCILNKVTRESRGYYYYYYRYYDKYRYKYYRQE